MRQVHADIIFMDFILYASSFNPEFLTRQETSVYSLLFNFKVDCFLSFCIPVQLVFVNCQLISVSRFLSVALINDT